MRWFCLPAIAILVVLGNGVVAANGHGQGLIGIGERVKHYGGEMRTETAHGGGFILSARLPLTEYRS